MQTFRYAVIGTGGIANWHISAFTGQPGVTLVGATDVSAEALSRVQEKHPGIVVSESAEQMLAEAKPDIVSICTPNKFHHAAALAAFAAGAHVACEKPMAMTLAEALEMEQAREKAGRLGLINFSYRNCDSFRFAKDMIASGDLGEIIRVNAVYLQSFLGADQPWAWRNDKSIAGFGALGDLGVHMIDGVRFITGQELVSVVGKAQTLIRSRRDGKGVDRPVTTDTNAAFLGELTGGALAVFETTQVAPGYGNHFRIDISGTRGTLQVLSERGEEIAFYGGGGFSRTVTWKTSVPWQPVPTDFPGRHWAKTPEALVIAARGQPAQYGTFADGVAAQRVLDAVGRSQASASWQATGLT